MASIAGNDLGQVQRERHTKDSGLINVALPASDSNETFLLDIFGVTRRISVEGIKTGTLAQLNTFIAAIEGIVNGDQSTSTFVSSLTTFANKTVLIQSFGWDFVAGQPNFVRYNLDLVEGT